MYIFLQEDIYKLFYNKFVVIIGDSIQRTIYKDFVVLLQGNKYLTNTQVRAKGEIYFSGDELVEGGKKGRMNNGINYREVRQYQSDCHLVRFYFVTRCYNNYVESILSDLSKEPVPDIILMNSCLWDISRYGINSVPEYKRNLDKLFTRFSEVLPKQSLVVWNTTMPISKNARGGFLVPEIEFMNSTLRLDILEGNFFARKIVVSHGFDVLDLHFFLRHHLHRRAEDGIHWDMTAHRRITNLILTHIAEAWGIKMPDGPGTCRTLDRAVNRAISFGPSQTINHSISRSIDGKRRSFTSTHLDNRQNVNFHVTQQIATDRYGGPIRKVNFAENPSMDNYHWTPYAQDNYMPPRGNINRSRFNPYSHNNNRNLQYQWGSAW
ncbi:hypothetical protein ScPMuIL_000874 [Solemya velum]